MHQLQEVSGGRNQAQSEEDQRVRRAISDAGDGSFAGYWLRQGVEDRPFRDGQRSDAEERRIEAGVRYGGRIRSCGRSEEDGEALRGHSPVSWESSHDTSGALQP